MDILNIIGVISFILLSIGILLISFYTYVFFSHEKEKNFPGLKASIAGVILSVFVSFLSMMLIPFDLISDFHDSGNSNNGIHFNMDLIWRLVMMTSVSLYLYNMFWLWYYKYSDPYAIDKDAWMTKKRVLYALKYLSINVAVALMLIIPASIFWGGRVRITYKVQSAKASQMMFAQNHAQADLGNNLLFLTSRYSPSWIVATTAPLVAYGSFLLYIIGGLGMATLPFSLILSYMRRPREPKPFNMVMSNRALKEISQANIDELKRLIELKKEIERLKQKRGYERVTLRRKTRDYQSKLVKCQETLINYEEMLDTKRKRHLILEENPVKYLSSLIAGVVATFFSLLIVSHTLLMSFGSFVIFETYFDTLQKLSLVVAVLGYMSLAIYMLFCVAKGFELLSSVFPHHFGYNQVKINRTWMDTWLSLVNILLPGSWAVVAFFLKATPGFLSFLKAGQIVNSFVNKIEYIRPFYKYNIFNGLLLMFFVIGLLMNYASVLEKEKLDVLMDLEKEKILELDHSTDIDFFLNKK